MFSQVVSQWLGIGKGMVLRVLKGAYKLNLLGDLHAQTTDVITEATHFLLHAMNHSQNQV